MFLSEPAILSLLDQAKTASNQKAEFIIQKSQHLKGLSLEETAILLQNKSQTITKKIFAAARNIKEKIYGRRLVIFAPLYTSNYCSNNCTYCGFRAGNKSLRRKRLTMEEVKEEVSLLENEGHKRILLVTGEDIKGSSIEFLEKIIPAIYSVKSGRGEIRRLNVNVAPLSVKDFKRLNKTGIGTYQLFQETYHPGTYQSMHTAGPKTDYANRLYAMHRAMEAGIKDIGLGVLFGLHDYKFEVLALLSHAQELEKKFGCGPHTISVPRIEPAHNTPLSYNPPAPVSDNAFKQIVAILRLAVPYTGLILSTRESAKLRNEVFGLGISQISAGSRTNPGGYKASRSKNHTAEQFSMHDNRSLLEVIKDISRMGYSPSFCTACYRLGRTGKDFMDLAKPGLIQKFCLPNSLITFKEYLLDYGDAAARQLGAKVIARELAGMKNKTAIQQALSRLENGERDICF
ncbi:MAG: [FeFe] hydrogenase H-cluster radical SAM maturase HydG [Candidatus Margulisiibacteriota bacterium]